MNVLIITKWTRCLWLDSVKKALLKKLMWPMSGKENIEFSVTTAVRFLFWCLCVLLHEVCMSQKNILLLWLVFGFFGGGGVDLPKDKRKHKETKFLCHSFVLCYAFPSRPHWASGGKQKSLFQSQLWSKKLLSHTEQLMERSWDMTLLQ